MQKSINIPLVTLKEIIDTNPNKETNKLSLLIKEELFKLEEWVYERQ